MLKKHSSFPFCAVLIVLSMIAAPAFTQTVPSRPSEVEESANQANDQVQPLDGTKGTTNRRG
jgi:hypothetical protein